MIQVTNRWYPHCTLNIMYLAFTLLKTVLLTRVYFRNVNNSKVGKGQKHQSEKICVRSLFMLIPRTIFQNHSSYRSWFIQLLMVLWSDRRTTSIQYAPQRLGHKNLENNLQKWLNLAFCISKLSIQIRAFLQNLIEIKRRFTQIISIKSYTAVELICT